jgi:hypothetical protein
MFRTLRQAKRFCSSAPRDGYPLRGQKTLGGPGRGDVRDGGSPQRDGRKCGANNRGHGTGPASRSRDPRGRS